VIILAPQSILILLLALAAAAGMWAMYRHGHPHLRRPFLWLLPLLRAMAVFLVVLTLTEPMLQRDVEQQLLSRLRFVVDESASMLVTDQDMPVDQKVEIALAHGWLDESDIDRSRIRENSEAVPTSEVSRLQLPGSGLSEIHRISELRETLQEATRSNASLEQARDTATRLADADLGELSLQAQALLREDWVPAVARRRQMQINAFAQQLNELESKLRAEFRNEFKGSIPEFDQSSRLDRVRHLLEAVESLKAEHEVSIELLGQSGPLTDLTSISPPGSSSGQAESIVLLSDGRHHAESTEPGDAASLWASAGAQLFTVRFGSTEPRTDLILMNTHQPRRLAPGDMISG
jgi:hypothetical protein